MLLSLLLSLLLPQAHAGDAPGEIFPPKVEQKKHVHKIHGYKRPDPYHWLKDPERKSPEVLAHLKAENEYTGKVMQPTVALQEKIFQEIKARIKEDDASVPYLHGGYYYYSRTEKGKQYTISARKKGSLSAPEEVLLDENEMAKGHSYFNTTDFAMSPSHKLMLVGIDTEGRNFYTLKVKDLEKNEWLPFQIEKTDGDVVWAADNETIFYVKQNPTTLRSERVIRFNIRTQESEEVFYEKDETFSVGLDDSRSGKYLFLSTGSRLLSEVRYLDAAQPLGEWAVFHPREEKHLYSVDDGGDRFFVISNENAKNYRVLETPYGQTGKENWKEVIPHREDVYLADVVVLKNHLVLKEKKLGLNGVTVYDRATYTGYSIPFSDKMYDAGPRNNPEFDAPTMRYAYQSYRSPLATYDFNLQSRKSKLVHVKEVPGYNADLYKADRIWVTVRDGVKVPVNLLMRKEEKLNGQSPLLVYGYGSYGISMGNGFKNGVISLVSRGFVYAEVGVRGGADLGKQWYEDGRVRKKMNSFYDFVDVTEALVKKGYGHPKRVYANGGSAGGLLVGAAMNLRPDLYAAVVANVPFVDVLSTMLDDSIPLTTSEYSEWGNPNVKEDYEYIAKYSPYDNVKETKYPYLLATTGIQDTQVPYWEPAKWVAKLRDHNQAPTFALLKTNLVAGHGGATGRYDSLKELAFDYAFLLLTDKMVRQGGGAQKKKR
jgi:oligopeptidase B